MQVTEHIAALRAGLAGPNGPRLRLSHLLLWNRGGTEGLEISGDPRGLGVSAGAGIRPLVLNRAAAPRPAYAARSRR